MTDNRTGLVEQAKQQIKELNQTLARLADMGVKTEVNILTRNEIAANPLPIIQASFYMRL